MWLATGSTACNDRGLAGGRFGPNRSRVEKDKYKLATRDGFVCFFFFSSRRRHTRWNCDWGSDVCSSDLGIFVAGFLAAAWVTATFVAAAFVGAGFATFVAAAFVGAGFVTFVAAAFVGAGDRKSVV